MGDGCAEYNWEDPEIVVDKTNQQMTVVAAAVIDGFGLVALLISNGSNGTIECVC